MKRIQYQLCAVYDTETCNIGEGNETRAFPILFIDNDIRDKDLYNYEVDKDDKITFYRYEEEYIARLQEYINYGEVTGKVPIVCAYNAMFDLQPLMWTLSQLYSIQTNAQSSTNIYTLDLYDKETNELKLRFWDTFHLELGGLKAMGETCGIAKATGDWDYSLIRTPATPLTELELFYAKRDVQVIPAYLRYLLHANEWLKQSELGSRVLTKTSLVRQMARHNIAQIKITKKDGKKLTLGKAFNNQCMAQLPETFGQYALRKGAFRGGFTFTSAAYANTIQRNVASLDVTSMHHTFINGRYTPQDFKTAMGYELQNICEQIVNTSRDEVMNKYYKPLPTAIHAVINFTNIRLKKGSCFDEWGIGLLAAAKFKKLIQGSIDDIGLDPRNAAQENVIKTAGWYDRFEHATFAFGKLYSADKIMVHVSELELWCMSRVYEWDKMECIIGEYTNNWKIPPDYVTLQSNILFEMKSDAKFVINHYTEGEPFKFPVPKSIPEGIANDLKNGTCSEQFLNAWYVSTVKGEFNGIYGTAAQDVYRPSYMCENGELFIDKETVTNEDNWEEHQPGSCKVFYTYGLRIVGGSRMHLVIALELLYEMFGKRIRVTGGDTDSIKVSCYKDITDKMLNECLQPIADCSKSAINTCMFRMRKEHPDKASNLTGVGSFDIEYADKKTKTTRYDYHMELWNKARISYVAGKCHITCAGLSRPEGQYTIEDFINELINNGNNIEEVFQLAIGYNVTVSNAICHSLEGYKPKAQDVYDKDVTDYEGNTYHVHAHQSNALYPINRVLGDTNKNTNGLTVQYLREKYNRIVNTENRFLYKTRYGAIIRDDNNTIMR